MQISIKNIRSCNKNKTILSNEKIYNETSWFIFNLSRNKWVEYKVKKNNIHIKYFNNYYFYKKKKNEKAIMHLYILDSIYSN